MFSANIIRAAFKELSKLPVGLKVSMIEAIEELEAAGTDLKEPKVRDIGNGLKELRVSASEGIARGFFFFAVGQQFYVVHILQKKTQKTPKKSLDLANQRMQEVKRSLKNV
ncbi:MULTISPECIES: type II toxin-antitoxin system RelE/ParE family toxin [Photorhabdus]|uniref:Type II toxin-antitoxin system RelE/ParE family toxin n=2 Tax=Photorhabdus TaxID=29487 RepID=A0ABX0AV52_9GAMM|nr:MULTISPECIES: type II toxin-antitoxin system RelE/ParE family toxin [Photorhabdus]MCC8376119.1 type II toxin-antitoxin system RelE/ParE family toxin [Photorhabdus bodei]MCC8465283.1 type II toxin-antitoxin system RelE/ParE family toxin [Photorhabdus bodei]MCT8353226.1 type II toxin-antitoxin system RelE/ParE family toxin [Photorhabdus kayaii]MDB6369595.1 type II toxin-antitoxin system RelE/ParE family toxin [Photorhabdus bodei]NDL11063.1 type II toxin-antitoxin system RelE/ParE family toxin